MGTKQETRKVTEGDVEMSYDVTKAGVKHHSNEILHNLYENNLHNKRLIEVSS